MVLKHSSAVPEHAKHARLNSGATPVAGHTTLKYSSVAQWRSNRLLTGRLLVRVQPGEFFYIKGFANSGEALFS